MEILHNFGIQPVLLLAQIVNFIIILVILRKFFYGPITKALDERKARIEESLKNADAIELKLIQTEEKTAKILEEARQKAQEIITGANLEADRVSQLAQDEAKQTIENSLKEAQDEIEKQKQEIQKELEANTLALIVEVTKKVLGRNLKQKEKQDLTNKALTQITKQVQ